MAALQRTWRGEEVYGPVLAEACSVIDRAACRRGGRGRGCRNKLGVAELCCATSGSGRERSASG